MVSVARQEINIIALNCISRARQRLATSELEMRALSQYGQLPECFFGKELKKPLTLNFQSLNCNKPALAVQ